jgi:hypothetical protein
MFISCSASAATGFKKWSAAHPAAKYAPKSNEATPFVPPVSDTSSPHPEHSAIHIRRAVRLRETAEATPVGGPLRARLLDLALQYDRMAANARHGSPEARQMGDE